MNRTVHLAMTVVLAIGSHAGADGGSSAFGEISGHYEAVRQALLKDSTDGVSEHARAIRAAAEVLQGDFSPERAGVSVADSEKARDLLPAVERGAGRLAAATGLENVRSAFAELTKPLVQWHALVEGARPVVAYCPMVRKPWLQPDEPIGNPYDPSMLRCGEVVAR